MRTLFVSRDKIIGDVSSGENYNIILSPHFYWVKIEELPVRFAFQAMKIAPSIFVDEIKDGDYRFKVKKLSSSDRTANRFAFVAYDQSEIEKKLTSLGLEVSKIHNIYFAQFEFEALKSDIRVVDDRVLSLIDGIVSMLKRPECDGRDILSSVNSLVLSKYALKLQGENFTLHRKFVILLFVLIVVLVVDLSMKKSVYSDMIDYEKAIIEKFDLPATSFEFDSIFSKFAKIDTKQREIRKNIYSIVSIPLKKGDFVSIISVKKSGLSAIIEFSDDSRVKKFKKELLSRDVNATFKLTKNSLKVMINE